MKIIHIGTTDNNGGAARASFRLHQGLIKYGINSGFFVKQKFSKDKSVYVYRKSKSYLIRVKSILKERQLKHELGAYTMGNNIEKISDARTSKKYTFYKQLPKADLYNLHWISDFVDIQSFFETINKPIVWTLHDMNPFTGGCHYTEKCEKFTISCGSCPQLNSHKENDITHKIWRLKEKAFNKIKKGQIQIVADSYWLENEAKRSPLFKGFPISTIHYGLDTETFKPLDKQNTRNVLGIPDNKKIIVFGAPGLDNKRKGAHLLIKALHRLQNKEKNIFLVTFGNGNLPEDIDIPTLNIGNVSNDLFLSVIYNAGDVFVIPSIQEAFGQTCLEAMSCGIPAVGFASAGGVKDMIENNVTGYLAPEINAQSLAEAISKTLTLSSTKYHMMSENCRQMALNEYTLETQAKRYLDVYNKLINN